eukprot:33204_1
MAVSLPIDYWLCDDLQNWIKKINLEETYKSEIINIISENDISGSDFNTLQSVLDIMDSFPEIDQDSANKIFEELIKIRTNDSSTKYSHTIDSSQFNIGQSIQYLNNTYTKWYRGNVKQIEKDQILITFNKALNMNDEWVLQNDYDSKLRIIIHEKIYGIIGLNNLGNTCFMNSVIQCLLQTPKLIQLFRTWQYSYENDDIKYNQIQSNNESIKYEPEMLDGFIKVARAAMQPETGFISPLTINKRLKNSDVNFGLYDQGDALSAISKMIEILDKNIIKRNNKNNDSKIDDHSGAWFIEGVKTGNNEEDMIKSNVLLYNTNKSLIREYIHFVERNIYTCMKCRWKETRYEMKEKILLPLQDHSIRVYVNIYIPSQGKNNLLIENKEFIVLDYCPITTLQYEIFEELFRNKNVEFELMDVNQISIYCIQLDRNKLIAKWFGKCNIEDECIKFVENSAIICAVIQSFDACNTLNILTKMNVFINNNMEMDIKPTCLEFEELK